MNNLDALPTPSDRRLAVRVKSAAQRKIRQGHPWVFDGSVEDVSHQGQPGDLAIVFDNNRDFLAVGLFDPGSPIRVRVLHHGRPRQIDADFWLDRLSVAIDRRAELIAGGETTGYRLVNGEGDGFPGLAIDTYAGVLVVKVYSEAWFAHLKVIVELLVALIEPRSVVVRFSRGVRAGETFGLAEGEALVGERPDGPVVFAENGLTFEADVAAGQKTGHFLDQRDNRAMVAGLSAGARVLDVFSCTGGFSVYAAAAGASEVHSVDLSGHALAGAERNMAHNAHRPDVAACRHTITRGDAFEVLGGLVDRRERFDLVVIDPPSFAQRRDQIGRALRAYGRLTDLGLGLVNDGDWLVQASCSSRVSAQRFVANVYERADAGGVVLRDEIVTGHGIDHPIAVDENRYLKALFARVSR